MNRDADPRAARDAISRRSLLKGVGAGTFAAGTSGLLAACGSGQQGGRTFGSGTIKIGFISPLTGELAGFAAGDRYVLSLVRQSSPYQKGIKVGTRRYPVEIFVRDTKSSPARAAQVAHGLITQHHVDLIVTTSTPEVVAPVAGVCEKLHTPCLSTVVPWEAWYGSLGGDPQKPVKTFTYNTTYFYGVKEFEGCFAPMWNQTQTNKLVACQFPDDPDGNAFRGGFVPLIEAGGYTVVDGGGYADGLKDFTPMITKFKNKNAEVFVNCPLPPDFYTFWHQASQQGWKPRIATVAKVLLFPDDLVPIGPLAANIATDSWWGPYMPNTSSLTGLSAKALADGYQAASGNQWLQTLGSTYSLFEVAKEAFSQVTDPHDTAEVASALHAVNYTGMCGALNFATGPAPGVAIQSPVGVQWKKTTSGAYPFEMTVVDNTLNPAVPVQTKLVRTNA